MMRLSVSVTATMVLSVGLCVSVVSSAYGDEATNLLSNGDFTKRADEKDTTPAGWSVVGDAQDVRIVAGEAPEGFGQSLRVDIKKQSGGHGQIRQKVAVEPGTMYTLRGYLRSTEPHVGFLQVKFRKDGKEIGRLPETGHLRQVLSTTKWHPVDLTFSSGEADELSIVCRYKQGAEAVGQAVWFTGLTLTAGPTLSIVGEAKHPADQKPGGDRYVTPTGAGSFDGTSWDNAYSAASLQHGWDQIGPGDTLHVGSGTYPRASFRLTSGGTDSEHYKQVLGVDTGGGLPMFISTWTRDQPDRGQTLIVAEEDVDYWWIQDIVVRRYRGAVWSRRGKGKHEGVRIINVDVTDSRDAIVLHGGAPDDDPARGTHDVLIKDCDLIGFTKRGVRLRDGVYDARVVNCVADAGGRPYATERFQIGFSVEGQREECPDHHITFINCTARNAYDNQGDKYWNADGFTAERNTHHIRYEGCEAYDNTDGGFDVKSPGAVFIDCIAMRNKRNYRIWSREKATMKNCLSAYARHPGGTGGPAGLHVCKDAEIDADHVTLAFNEGPAVLAQEREGALLTLRNCILADDDASAQLIKAASGVTIRRTDTTTWVKGGEGGEGEDPQFIHADPDWDGEGEDFNSGRYGRQRGFHQGEPDQAAGTSSTHQPAPKERG